MNKYIVAAIVFVACAQAQAQTEIPLTVKAAVERALSQRAELKIEDANRRAAEQRLAAARAAFYPSVDLLADASRIDSQDTYSGVEVSGIINGSPIVVSVARAVTPYQSTAALESTWNIYAGGLDTAHLREARAEFDAAQAQWRATRRKLILDAAGGYWELRKAQIHYAQAQARATYAADVAQLAETQWRQGRVSALAREQEAVRSLEAELNAKDAQRELTDRWQTYRDVLALRDVPESTIPDMRDDPRQFNIDALFASGDAVNPELMRVRAEAQAAQARTAVARAGNYPKLDLFARYQGVGRDTDSIGGSITDLHRQDNIVGLRVRWNLFNGGQTRANARETQAAAEAAQLRIDQSQRTLGEDYRSQSSRVARAEDALKLAERRRALAAQELNVAKARFDLKQITALQLRVAELALGDADEKLNFSYIDRIVAVLALKLAQL